MVKNLLYLIDTRSFELIVTLFTVTVNKNGDLLLRFVKELGVMSNVNSLVEEAFVAVTTKEFQSKKDSNFALTFQSNDASINRVAFVVEDLNKPFEITILGKKMRLSKPQKTPSASDYVVSAILENANIQATSGISTIIKGDATHVYELYELQRNDSFSSLEDIPKESEVKLYNLPRANLDKNPTAEEFGEDWKNSVLKTMSEFFVTGEEYLIPLINGNWGSEYIEGKSFPYMKFFSKIPSLEEWNIFFRLPLCFLGKPLKKVG